MTNFHPVAACKNLVYRLPFGLSGIFTRPYDRIVGGRRQKIRTARKFSREVTAHNLNSRVVNVVYDNYASPPTIGDFLLVVMLARHLSSLARSVHFTIISGEYREDWDDASRGAQAALLQLQITIAKNLLQPQRCVVNECSWSAAGSELFGGGDSFTFGKELVSTRLPIYNHSFNTLNRLLANQSPVTVDKCLLWPGQLAPFGGFRVPDRRYIAWHARYSASWAPERNLTPEQFFQVAVFLKEFYPDHDHMIISDQGGCDHFRRLARRDGLELLFSRDFSTGFLGDAELTIRSDLYLQFLGGGIGIVPMFSRTPYVIVDRASSEEPWSSSAFCSWQTPAQRRLHRRDEQELEALFETSLDVLPPGLH